MPVETISGDADSTRSWRALIPHQGAMCLLDDILAWDENAIHARSRSHLRIDNPLRSDGCLRAVHLCEYGAQAMAVHGGLIARAAGSTAAPGFLVSLRAVELALARIDDLPDALDVYAEKLVSGETGWQYLFRIEHAGAEIARGRAVVLAATRALQGG
jgi:predicted hotdog family 3-hydroxylacyl-ACP dehydratase